jgi:hypothetical protein
MLFLSFEARLLVCGTDSSTISRTGSARPSRVMFSMQRLANSERPDDEHMMPNFNLPRTPLESEIPIVHFEYS